MSLQAPICFQANHLAPENSTNCCRRDKNSGACCKQDKDNDNDDDDDDKEEEVILYQPEVLFSFLSRGLAPIPLANTNCGRGTRTTATTPLDIHAPEFRLPVLPVLPVSTTNKHNKPNFKTKNENKDETKKGRDSASAVFYDEILPFLAHPISPNASSSSPVFACYEQCLWHWSVATEEQFSIAERLIKLVFFDKETSKAEYLERLAHTKKLYKKMRSVRRFRSKTDSLFFSEEE